MGSLCEVEICHEKRVSSISTTQNRFHQWQISILFRTRNENYLNVSYNLSKISLSIWPPINSDSVHDEMCVRRPCGLHHNASHVFMFWKTENKINFMLILQCWKLIQAKESVLHYFLSSWWPPLWSSGQSLWLQIQRYGFDSRGYLIFWEVVDLERGSTQRCEYNWGATQKKK
jgi:hypothetical protein